MHIAGFERFPGTAQLRIADLSRPRIEVDIDLDDGSRSGVELRWTGLALSAGSFSSNRTGHRIDGRFHGPAHEEAWGVFDTRTWVGAFGARRT